MSFIKSLCGKDKKSSSKDQKRSSRPKSHSGSSSDKRTPYDHGSYPESKYTAKHHYAEYSPDGKYYPISDSDSERTLTVPISVQNKETLAMKQERAAKQQIEKYDVDSVKPPKSSSKSKSKSKSTSHSKPSSSSKGEKGAASTKDKKKLGRWFDLSSLATPIAVYNLPADFNGDDPNVYWDEEAKVWRYWYYTWCPIF